MWNLSVLTISHNSISPSTPIRYRRTDLWTIRHFRVIPHTKKSPIYRIERTSPSGRTNIGGRISFFVS